MTMMTMMTMMIDSSFAQANGDDDDGDVIDLRDMPGINSFSDIRDVAQNKGGDVVLRFSNDNQLRIEDFKVEPARKQRLPFLRERRPGFTGPGRHQPSIPSCRDIEPGGRTTRHFGVDRGVALAER